MFQTMLDHGNPLPCHESDCFVAALLCKHDPRRKMLRLYVLFTCARALSGEYDADLSRGQGDELQREAVESGGGVGGEGVRAVGKAHYKATAYSASVKVYVLRE